MASSSPSWSNLPRQFHVAVVENHDERDIRTAAWLFPAYLVLINLFVVPLAIAGQKAFPKGSINRDLTVLALPLNAARLYASSLTNGVNQVDPEERKISPAM
jgi:Na+/proline symporter